MRPWAIISHVSDRYTLEQNQKASPIDSFANGTVFACYESRETGDRLLEEQAMTTKMKAFVMQGIGKVEFVDKPMPEPGPNDAIVKTTRAFVCTFRCPHAQGCDR